MRSSTPYSTTHQPYKKAGRLGTFLGCLGVVLAFYFIVGILGAIVTAFAAFGHHPGKWYVPASIVATIIVAIIIFKRVRRRTT